MILKWHYRLVITIWKTLHQLVQYRQRIKYPTTVTPQKWTARLAFWMQRHKPRLFRKTHQMCINQLVLHTHFNHRHLNTKTVRTDFHRLATLQITDASAQHDLVPTQVWDLVQRYHVWLYNWDFRVPLWR